MDRAWPVRRKRGYSLPFHLPASVLSAMGSPCHNFSFSCWMPPPPLSHLGSLQESWCSFPHARFFRCRGLSCSSHCFLLLQSAAWPCCVGALTRHIPLKKSPFSPKFHQGQSSSLDTRSKRIPFQCHPVLAPTLPGFLHSPGYWADCCITPARILQPSTVP